MVSHSIWISQFYSYVKLLLKFDLLRQFDNV